MCVVGCGGYADTKKNQNFKPYKKSITTGLLLIAHIYLYLLSTGFTEPPPTNNNGVSITTAIPMTIPEPPSYEYTIAMTTVKHDDVPTEPPPPYDDAIIADMNRRNFYEQPEAGTITPSGLIQQESARPTDGAMTASDLGLQQESCHDTPM